MERKSRGPVALMLCGKMDDAAKMYLKLYADLVEEGDRFIGPHLLYQLHFCIAGKEPRRAPEDSTEEVERMVLHELRKREIDVDERIVTDDIAIAKNTVLAARKSFEKSFDC